MTCKCQNQHIYIKFGYFGLWFYLENQFLHFLGITHAQNLKRSTTTELFVKEWIPLLWQLINDFSFFLYDFQSFPKYIFLNFITPKNLLIKCKIVSWRYNTSLVLFYLHESIFIKVFEKAVSKENRNNNKKNLKEITTVLQKYKKNKR